MSEPLRPEQRRHQIDEGQNADSQKNDIAKHFSLPLLQPFTGPDVRNGHNKESYRATGKDKVSHSGNSYAAPLTGERFASRSAADCFCGCSVMICVFGTGEHGGIGESVWGALHPRLVERPGM
jgi:hypothetical protein